MLDMPGEMGTVGELLRLKSENEWFLCSCMAAGYKAIEFAWLLPEDFTVDVLKKFWGDFISHGDWARAAIDHGIIVELTEWINKTPTLARPEEYARAISNLSYLCKIVTTSTELTRQALKRDIVGVSRAIEKINVVNPTMQVVLPNANTIHDEFKVLLQQTYGSTIFSRTELDAPLGGFYPTEVSVLASRPSMGKTSFAMQVAREVASSGKRKVVYISLEMTKIQLWARMACGAASVEWRFVRSGNVPASVLPVIEAESEKLKKQYGDRLIICDEAMTVQDILQVCLQVNPDLLIVDHLGEIDWPKDEEEVRWYGKATKYLKDNIAKKLGAHVMILHQLNRGVESRPDKRPFLSDLRWSGDIEQKADTVIMLYREDYYSNDNFGANRVPVEFLIRKHRQGAMNVTVVMDYDLKEQWFYPIQSPFASMP